MSNQEPIYDIAHLGHLELLTGAAVVFVIAAFPQGAMGFLRNAAGRLARRSTNAGGGHASR